MPHSKISQFLQATATLSCWRCGENRRVGQEILTKRSSGVPTVQCIISLNNETLFSWQHIEDIHRIYLKSICFALNEPLRHKEVCL